MKTHTLYINKTLTHHTLVTAY